MPYNLPYTMFVWNQDVNRRTAKMDPTFSLTIPSTIASSSSSQ